MGGFPRLYLVHKTSQLQMLSSVTFNCQVRLSWVQVLNCQNFYQCLKCHKSPGQKLSILGRCKKTGNLRPGWPDTGVNLFAEVNISSFSETPVPGWFFLSRAEIFKLGCFVQKYWSGYTLHIQRHACLTIWIWPN